MSDHLTTGCDANIKNLLASLCSKKILLAIIAVNPRRSHTGMLDEQNVWIKRFWTQVLTNFEGVVGCRILWNTVFFAFDLSKYENIESRLETILSQLREPELKSTCILCMSGDDEKKMLSDLDKIQEETSSDRNLGKYSYVHARIVDGYKL